MPENRINIRFCIQFLIKISRITLISKRKLIAKVIETVINRRCRKHQHLSFHARFNHPVHKSHISVFFFTATAVCTVAVTEIMALVNNDQIIVSPVNTIYRKPYYSITAVTREVCVIQNIVAQTILYKRVIDQISSVCHPVFGQLLRTKHKDIFVSAFIVFDHCEGSESLTKSDAVSQDAAVILFQLIDNGKCSILLKIEQLIPYHAILKASGFIRQNILRDIFQKLIEDVVERHKIDEFRCIFLINCGNHFNDFLCHISKLFFICPY